MHRLQPPLPARIALGLICVLLVACGGANAPAATPTMPARTPTTAPTSAVGSAAVRPTGATGASVVAPTVAAASTIASTAASGSATAARGSAAAQVTAAPQGTVPGTSAAASSVAGNPNVRRDDLTVDFGDFQTRAQLSYPASGTGPFPTVVLIPGTGPYDMDFTLFDRTTGKEKSHIFRDIADSLTANGYAVVRYNKHFITGPTSQFDPAILQKFYALPQKQLLADADKVYQSAKTNPKVDPKQIILYAWSEGTTHATQLVLMHPEIAGLILQGPVAGTWAQIFTYQLLDLGFHFLRDIADTDHDGAVTLQEILTATQKNPGTVSGYVVLMTLDLSPPPPTNGTPAAPAGPRLNAAIDRNNDGKLDIGNEILPFFQGFFANFDQNAANSPFGQYSSDKTFPPIINSLPAYKGPVLILQGANDANVPPIGAKQIDDALAASGHPDHTLINYPNLGHSLGQAPTVYADDFPPIDPKPLADTAAWLAKRFRK